MHAIAPLRGPRELAPSRRQLTGYVSRAEPCCYYPLAEPPALAGLCQPAEWGGRGATSPDRGVQDRPPGGGMPRDSRPGSRRADSARSDRRQPPRSSRGPGLGTTWSPGLGDRHGRQHRRHSIHDTRIDVRGSSSSIHKSTENGGSGRAGDPYLSTSRQFVALGDRHRPNRRTPPVGPPLEPVVDGALGGLILAGNWIPLAAGPHAEVAWDVELGPISYPPGHPRNCPRRRW